MQHPLNRKDHSALEIHTTMTDAPGVRKVENKTFPLDTPMWNLKELIRWWVTQKKYTQGELNWIEFLFNEFKINLNNLHMNYMFACKSQPAEKFGGKYLLIIITKLQPSSSSTWGSDNFHLHR